MQFKHQLMRTCHSVVNIASLENRLFDVAGFQTKLLARLSDDFGTNGKISTCGTYYNMLEMTKDSNNHSM